MLPGVGGVEWKVVWGFMGHARWPRVQWPNKTQAKQKATKLSR